MLAAHGVKPAGQALQRGQEQDPGELNDVEDPLDNVVCEGAQGTESLDN